MNLSSPTTTLRVPRNRAVAISVIKAPVNATLKRDPRKDLKNHPVNHLEKVLKNICGVENVNHPERVPKRALKKDPVKCK